jgi:hypothetical protein
MLHHDDLLRYRFLQDMGALPGVTAAHLTATEPGWYAAPSDADIARARTASGCALADVFKRWCNATPHLENHPTPPRVGFSSTSPVEEPDWTAIQPGWYARPRLTLSRALDRWEIEYDTINDYDEPHVPALQVTVFDATFALENPVPADKLKATLDNLQPELVALGAALDELSYDGEVSEPATELAETISRALTSLSEDHVMDYWEVLDAKAKELVAAAFEYVPDGFELRQRLLDEGGVDFSLVNTETGESTYDLLEHELEDYPEVTIEWAVGRMAGA